MNGIRALLVVLVAQSVQAERCATLNQHGFTESGITLDVVSSKETNVESSFNDHMSTIVLEPQCNIEVFEHADFGGLSKIFRNQDSQQSQITLPYHGWDDKISSYKCHCDCTKRITTDTNFEYKVVGELADTATIWFSVLAQSDIHIALAKDRGISTNGVEIVFGGYSSQRSQIRGTHQSQSNILADISHSVDQFKTWQQSFYLEINANSFGLYDNDNNVIMMAENYDTSDMNYLAVSTGWGSDGNWEIANTACLAQPEVWTLKWNTDGNPGGVGFTIYDEQDNQMFERKVSKAEKGDGATISVSGIIKKVVINSNSDGFHGQFEVRDSFGDVRQLICSGCEDTSTSLVLGSLYVDNDQNGDLEGYGNEENSNCVDDCQFILEGHRIWNGETNVAGWTATGGNRPTTSGDDKRLYDNMFDGDSQTYWHGFAPFDVTNAVTVTFHESIKFVALTVTVRNDWNTISQGRYQNLCLYVDDTEDVCTTADRETSAGEFITFKPRNIKIATKIELRFAEKVGIVAELRIIYDPVIYDPVAISNCPSAKCWSYSTEDGCTLKDSRGDCSYTLTCGAERIDIAFGEHLFGAGVTDFISNTCLTAVGSGFTWGGPLGSCSEIITKDSVDGKIGFSQTIGTNARTGTDISGTTVYTSAVRSVTVTFTCKYDATASATSGDIDVTTPLDVTGNVIEIDGAFDDALSMKFYKTNEFAEENTAAQVIGSKLFMMVSWSVTTLTDKVGFYVQSCTVVDVAPTAAAGIKIVDNSCYAKVVSAKLISEKFVYEKSQMEYNAFSFETAEKNSQKLQCLIVFCVVNDDGNGNLVPDCDGIVDQGSQATDCPTNAAIYEYTHNGE